MNLNLGMDVLIKNLISLVSIPIRDLMNLNPSRFALANQMDAKFQSLLGI